MRKRFATILLALAATTLLGAPAQADEKRSECDQIITNAAP